MTVMGVASGLESFDQRYIFAGARFLLYTTTGAPILLMFLLPISPIYPVLSRRLGFWPEHFWKWLTTGSVRAYVIGIAVSVVSIEFPMRLCLQFENVLVKSELSGPGDSLFFVSEWKKLLFLFVLLGSIGVAVAIWRRGVSQADSGNAVWLHYIGLFSIGVQFIFLPINYGTYFDQREVPRVRVTTSAGPALRDHTTWLIAEGPDDLSFFVWQGQGKIVSIPKRQITQVEIECYNDLLSVRFNHEAVCPS